MKELNTMEKAYFAGIFDGDGSFSLCKRIDRSSVLYIPLIQLSTTYKKLPEKLKEVFGGSVSIRAKYIGKDGSPRKESYGWKLYNSHCDTLLKSIVNFLIVKQDQAKLLMHYISTNKFVRRVAISSEKQKERAHIYAKMKNLNKKNGVSKVVFPRKRKTVEDGIFWSYLAGLMDTDGSFTIKKQKNGYYAPVISLTMKNNQAIRYILQNCEYGAACIINAITARSGYCYRFGVYKVEECIFFLEHLIPYMDIKKPMAEVLLLYCKEKKCNKDIDNALWYERIVRLNGVYKSFLIDLEAYSESHGDKAEDI